MRELRAVSGQLDGTYARGPVAAAVSDAGWSQAVLDVEAALGGPPLTVAGGGSDSGHQVRVGSVAPDVLATAMALVAGRALAVLLPDARAAAEAAAKLARARREAGGWAATVDSACRPLEQLRLPVQISRPEEPDTAAVVARRLGLAEPGLPGLPDPSSIAELADALAELAGALSGAAHDVAVSEHLRDTQEAAAGVLACARRVPALAATVRAAPAADHHAVSELLAVSGSVAAWTRELLTNLDVS